MTDKKLFQDFEKYADQRPMNGPISTDLIGIVTPYLEKIGKNGKVLDFGCGDGRYFSFFKRFFKEENIYGVEVSKKRIENCRNIGWENTFLIKENNHLPFEDNFFDFINFDQVIEHILEKDIDFYLNEMNRVLKPSGILTVITPNYPIKRVYDLIIGLKSMNWSKIKDDPTHVSFYNSDKLLKLLVKKFNNVKIILAGGSIYKLIPTPFFSHKIVALCTEKK